MPKEKLKAFVERTTLIGRIARLHRQRKLRKKYIVWQKSKSSGAMPDYGKQQVVIDYIKRFGFKIFIETGTYNGRMVYAMIPHVDTIYSIELEPVRCRRAQQRFTGYSNIHIVEGQSGEVLPNIVAQLDQPCLFWLDAHYSGGSTAKGPQDTPIMQEIACLLNHPLAGKHVILIDDACCFVGRDGYPALDEFRECVVNAGQGLGFTVENDIIRIYAKENREQ